jgi:phthiocerol/phenolphthiocerol synthesis type-I polyketide synthase E
MSSADTNGGPATGKIAVVGMAGRFPQAPDLEAFWRNLRQGTDAITDFPLEEAEFIGGLPGRDTLVTARGLLDDVDRFDAELFGLTPREAEVTDPQHRIFLECALEALEHAGCDPVRYPDPVGIFGGAGAASYATSNLLSNVAVLSSVDPFVLNVGNSPDFLTSRVSYLLGLRGPSMTVQTACSTSLAAVHAACRSLLAGDCEVALAGGVNVSTPQKGAVKFQPGGIMSADGRCRAFDADASGTSSGEGVGVVVLKRLERALADGDTIHAVVLGTHLVNDGARKDSFTAPSLQGLVEVIAGALSRAGVSPETIGYVEAHGSGTMLGDSTEVAALKEAFGEPAPGARECLLGSVKTSIGHLDAAAGIAAFIKTVLALKHRQIPASLHFERPNPKIGLEGSRFRVVDRWTPWEAGEAPRRACVNALGIGGTNVHVVLEEPPAPQPARVEDRWRVFPLSAVTETALERLTDAAAEHLETLPETAAAHAAYTLATGRRQRAERRFVVARDVADAARALQERDEQVVVSGRVPRGHERRTAAFMFPGVGDHYAGMGRGLHRTEPVYRAALDRCCDLLVPLVGRDLCELLHPAGGAPETEDRPEPRQRLFAPRGTAGDGSDGEGNGELDRTLHAHAAVFAVEYALAEQWKAWGIAPAAVVGHSVGEYAAACVAGVFSLEDALRLVCARARLIESVPEGGMVAAPLTEEAVAPFLGDGLCLAAVNAPAHVVLAGPVERLERLEAELAEKRIVSVRLPTARAFHSAMMDPVRDALLDVVRTVEMHAPAIPLVSSVTGTWLTDAEACDPAYWADHLSRTVRFADGVATLLEDPARVLLEVGPGQTLATAARQQMDHGRTPAPLALASLRGGRDPYPDQAFLLETLGRLWIADVPVDWDALFAGETPRRIPLPTYPFERKRHWVERVSPATVAAARTPAPAAAPATVAAAAGETSVGTGDLPASASGDDDLLAEIRAQVAEHWTEILGIPDVGHDQNFFHIGGSSLLAMQVASRISERYEIELPISVLFEQPTIAGTASAIETLLVAEFEAMMERDAVPAEPAG